MRRIDGTEPWSLRVGRGLICLMLVAVFASDRSLAAERTFTLQGRSVSLEDVTDRTEVYYEPMRFNRAAGVWNSEVTVKNVGDSSLSGPLVVSIESFSNTSGPLDADGVGDGPLARSYYDLSGYLNREALLPDAESRDRTISLGRTSGVPRVVTRVFSIVGTSEVPLASVRTLDIAGHPLVNVSVVEVSPAAIPAAQSDPRFGLATLGGKPGEHIWRFDKDGYLPVWRRQELGAREVELLANPILTPRSETSVGLTAEAAGGISTSDQSIRITAPAGSVDEPTDLYLTPVTAQTLPTFLPPGWSPVQGFWVETDMSAGDPLMRFAFDRPLSAEVVAWETLPMNQPLVFLRWNAEEFEWEVLELVQGTGRNPVRLDFASTGAFALVVPDEGETAPPSAQVGQALEGVSLPPLNLQTIVAEGSVTPEVSPVSVDPEMVTAEAAVTFASPDGAVPSGTVLRCEVTEEYALQSGVKLTPPRYERFIAAYRSPGVSDATGSARFPLRPLLLLGADQLVEATVRVAVLEPTKFAGAVIGSDGGTISAAGVRVEIEPGDLESRQGVTLNPLFTEDFAKLATDDYEVVSAFELTVAGLAGDASLAVQLDQFSKPGDYVLARVEYRDGLFGLDPVERLSGVRNLGLTSAEPRTGRRLPGLDGAGQYVILRAKSPLGLVNGVARDATGQPSEGLPVRIVGQPWLRFSGPDGTFEGLLAPRGGGVLAVNDPTANQSGYLNFQVADPASETQTDAGAGGAGPQVISVSPSSGATDVSRVTAVTVQFSKPVQSASLLPDGVLLLDGGGQPVPAALNLNLARTIATLLPDEQLAAATTYAVLVASSIVDASGQVLEGPTEFMFTTERDPTRPLGGQVTSHEPDETGMARMIGTAGLADPESPVILVNETTGRTATVLSKVDGSFDNFIAAEETDFLSATFVNQNGTRVTMPVSRQLFDDGSVGLFSVGGTIAVENDELGIEMEVPPGAIPGRTKFKIEPLAVAELTDLTNDTPPHGGTPLGLFDLKVDGDALLAPARFTFQIDFSDFEVPPDKSEDDVALMVTAPQVVNEITPDGPADIVAYEYLSKLEPVVSEGGISAASVRPQSFALFLYAAFFNPTDGRNMIFGSVQYLQTEIRGRTEAALFRSGRSIYEGTEIRVPNAVVRARAGGANSRPFTLQPGEIYSRSDSDGVFSLLVPNPPPIAGGGLSGSSSFGGHVLVATHPNYPRQFATGEGLRFNPDHPLAGGVVTFDRGRPADNGPPSLVVTHAPALPAAGAQAVVRVEAIDESGPPVVTLVVDSVTPASAATLLTMQSPAIWQLECSAPAKVVLRASAQDGFGNSREVTYPILFGQSAPPSPPPNDPVGPYVIFSQPDALALGISTISPISVRFNEFVDPDILANPNTYLTLTPGGGVPRVEFGRDQREVVVHYSRLENATDYQFTIQGLGDLTGQILDQNPDPSSPPVEPFILEFRTATEVHASLANIDNGGGVVTRGAFAYVIDRDNSTLSQFDISIPSQPVRVAQRFLTGPPRAIAMMPDYSFATGWIDDTPDPTPPRVATQTDLVAITGKVLGQTQNYLRIYDIRQPLDRSGHLAGAILALDDTSLITRLEWSAPYLVAVENNLDAPSIHVLNGQTLLLSDAYTSLTAQELRDLPFESVPGVDVNSDGDFVDPGDQLPLVGRDVIDFVAGQEDTFSLNPFRLGPNGGFQYLDSTARFINDVAVDGTSGFVGALIGPGIDRHIEAFTNALSTNITWRPTSLRSFIVGQTAPDTALPPPTGGRYVLEFEDWQPKQALMVPVGLQKLVLVNLISSGLQTNSLRVIDATRPDFLFQVNEIPLSVADFGLLQGSRLDDRGRIALSTVKGTNEHLVFLDPRKLQLPAPVIGDHPAIIGTVAGGGAGPTSFAVHRYGVSVSSLRNRNIVTQTSPFIQLLPPTTNAFELINSPNLTNRLDELFALREPDVLPVARHPTNSNLIPFNPAFHWHVVAEAPGGAGSQISLALLSLDVNGDLVTRTNNVVPPSFEDDLRLRRLSSDPYSPAYNVYLSDPIALLQEDLDISEYNRVTANRTLLYGGSAIRIGIPESMQGNAVLGPFAGQGMISQNPPPNAPPVRLGVSLGRPIDGIIPPLLTADDPVVIHTTVDGVNGIACPGGARLNFWHNLDCKVSITIDGQPLMNVQDENGNLIADFTDVSSTAGAHWVFLEAGHVGDPGEHTFEVTGREFDGHPTNVTIVAPGRVLHEVEINHAYGIGHTIVEGVDIWDGHLTHSRQDVMVPGRKLSLDFSRSYSSQGNSSDGPLGAGWTHSYNCRLIERCGVFTVVGGEGSGNSFTAPAANPAKAALFAPLLPVGLNPADLDFFDPQIGYHSNLVRDRNRADEAWFFTKTGMRYHFVVEGALTSSSALVYTLREIREPNGNILRFDYLDNDPDPVTLDTVTEIDPLGGLPKRGFRFEYQPVFQKPRITTLRGFNHQGSPDLLGLEVHYAYDQWGNLTNVVRLGPTAVETRNEAYVYTPGDGPTGHNLLEYHDPNGAITRYSYLPAGANPSTNYYTSNGSVLSGLPPHEIVFDVTHVGDARPGFVATDDVSTGFRYDFANSLRFVRDPRPVDSDGNPIPETEYEVNLFGATTRITAPLGQETIMEWATDHTNGSVLDEAGQPVNDILMTYRKDPEGQEQFFEYHDGRGNLTRERTVFNMSTKKPVTDARGATVTEIESTYEYDPLFNERTFMRDAEGNPTTYELYPDTGNLRKVIDAMGFETGFTYYPNGDLQTRSDQRGKVTRFQRYDIYGNCELIEDPLSNETESRYDERSRLEERWDAFKHHSTFDYDSLDRQTRQSRLNDLSGLATGPHSVSRTAYLAGGQSDTTTNPLGLVTRHFYDALNREVRSVQMGVRKGDGTTDDYTSRVAYDRAGNMIEETDARGVTRTHFYDALSRRVRTEVSGRHGGPFNGTGVVSILAYDSADNIVNETDMHGFTTIHEHDALYRVVESHLPFTNAAIFTRYDRVGNKTRVTDANGNPTVFAYDDLYRMVSATDAENNVVEYGYDRANNRTNSFNLSTRLRTSIAYDNTNREVGRTVTGPGLPAAGYFTETRYDDGRNEVTIVNPRGYATRTRSDGLDRVAETVVDDGNLGLESRFTYDEAGNVLTVRDPQNNDTDLTHNYDQLSRRLKTAYVRATGETAAPFETFRYDQVGNLVGSTDRRGFDYRSSYDNLGRPLDRELNETISASGWLPLIAFEYDDSANSVTTRDARNNPTVTLKDELGRPGEIADPLGQTVSFTYDGVNMRSQTDKRRQRTTFTYDRLNRLRTTTEFDAGGSARTSTEIVYLDTQRRQRTVDRRGLVTISEFDALGRLIGVERSGGDIAALYGTDPLPLESREYDGNSNLIRVIDGNLHITEHAYDSADRMTNTVAGATSAVAATNMFKIDRIGNVVEVKDARSHGNTFDLKILYDERYRRVATVNSLSETNRFEYDAADNLIREIEPLGYETSYEYDELNALLSVDERARATSGDAGVTRFRYDENRNRVAQQDAGTNLVTFAFDALNRLTNTVQHLVPGALGGGGGRDGSFGGGTGLTWSFGYDGNNNLNAITDAREQQATLDYDHLDRLVKRTYANHSETDALGRLLDFQPIELTFAYDGNGNPTNCVEVKQLGSGTITERVEMAYDGLDRLIGKTRFDHDDPVGRRLEFGYDVVGNRTNLVVMDTVPRVTGYAYDERNRLLTATLEPGASALTTRYQWEPDSLLRRIDYPGGSFTTRGYDDADRLLSITNAHLGGVVYSRYHYNYDLNGNRTNQVELLPAISPFPETTGYSYDRLNRLTRVAYGPNAISYTYAPNGNRLSEIGNDPVTGAAVNREFHYSQLASRPGATFNNVNALTRIEDRLNAAQTVEYEYDRNLNQVARVQDGDRREFRFDIRDQMIEATTPGGLTGSVGTVRFDYNWERLRAKKLFQEDETRYLYDDNAVLLEYGNQFSGHAIQRKYEYGYQLLAIGEPDGGALSRDFYLSDAQMSTANLVASDGTLTHSYRYDAWGGLRAEQGSSDNPRQFTGHFRDSETGLHYMGARYYDDEQARFLSQDPYMGEANTPPSLHRYLYSYANPARYHDPTGFAPQNSDEGDKWIAETKKYLKQLDEQLMKDAEAATPGAAEIIAAGRKAEVDLQRMNEERKRMLAESGLTEGDLANPVLADRAKWGMALLRRDLGNWVADGDGGILRPVVATAVETVATLASAGLETGASAGTVSGKLDVGAEVTTGEWIAAAGDVLSVAGNVGTLGKIGFSALSRRAAQQAATRAARGAVISEARRSIGEAAADSVKLINKGPQRIAAERQALAIGRDADIARRAVAAETRAARAVRKARRAADNAGRMSARSGHDTVVGSVFDEKTAVLHGDFMEVALKSDEHTKGIHRLYRKDIVRVNEVSGLEPYGVFHEATPNDIFVRGGLRSSDKAEYWNTVYHELTHAYSYMHNPNRSYRGTEAFVEEFYANVRGVQGEIRQLGLSSGLKSTARKTLESRGYKGLALDIYRDYRIDDPQFHASWQEIVEALGNRGITLK